MSFIDPDDDPRDVAQFLVISAVVLLVYVVMHWKDWAPWVG